MNLLLSSGDEGSSRHIIDTWKFVTEKGPRKPKDQRNGITAGEYGIEPELRWKSRSLVDTRIMKFFYASQRIQKYIYITSYPILSIYFAA